MCSILSSSSGVHKWLMLAAFSTALAACGDDGRDPVLGTKGNVALSPTVTAVTPANNATDVTVINPLITAQFSEAVNLLTTSQFTVTCASPCTSPTGTVSMNSANTKATFTVNSPAMLDPLTEYTATIHTATSSANGLSIDQPYVWSFTTGITPDTTRPVVTSTEPATSDPGPTENVPFNTAISVEFSEDMLASTVSVTSFTLTCETPCVAPSGSVSYDTASRIAVFVPEQELAPETTYTATMDSTVTDLAGNGLDGNQGATGTANDYLWQFTTSVAPDTTRPMVTVTQPETSDPGPTTDVPFNTAISAAFSEEMLATTITGASFTLTCEAPCVSPAGAVSYDQGSRIAVFVPEQQLDPDTTYTATVNSSVTDLAGNELEGNQGVTGTASDYLWQFTTSMAPDTTRPQVTNTEPATSNPGPTDNVPFNAAISAAFDEDMLTTTITLTSFTVTCEAPCVSPGGNVFYDAPSRIAVFSPDQDLDPDTTYTATIHRSVTDLAGNELDGNQGATGTANDYVWQFTTSVAPDTTRPVVTSTEPATSDPGPTTDVPFNTAISVEFSEDMLASTVSVTSFTLTCETPCVAPSGSVSYDTASRIAVFVPEQELAPETTYTATMDSTVTDLAGNGLDGNQGTTGTANDYLWQFTTSVAPDTTRPMVTVTQPETSDPGPTTDVPFNTAISAAFSEEMLATTITGASFTLTCEAPCVSPAGAVSYDQGSRIAVFVPEQQLDPDTTYTATVNSSVTDLAGNELEGNQGVTGTASDYVWQFRTSAAPDTTRPEVIATDPLTTSPGPTTNVPLNTTVSAVFSEDMLATTINVDSFTVTCASPCVSPSGTVSYELAARTAVFTPDQELEWETTYTATVNSTVTDLAGNFLAGNQGVEGAASNYVWQFRTEIKPDTTMPRVILTEPVTSDPGPTTDVPVNTAIKAVFSEDMLASTITGTSFTLTCESPCLSPVGDVTYVVDSLSAVFTPEQSLEEGATYTATIKNTATDVAGNQLAGNQGPVDEPSDYVWMFITVAPAPANNIFVQSTDPLDAGMLAVCPNASINATFEIPSGQRLDPTTVNDMTFLVVEDADPLNTVSAESIEVDVDTGTIVTFIPLNQLAENVTYRATLVSGPDGVKDLMVPGNEMVDDYVWTFTTTAPTESCLQPVDLQTATPFGTFGGTAGVTNQGLLTIINGDLGTTGASTLVTGFVSEPDCQYTITTLNEGQVNGKIYTAPPPPTVACPQDGTAVTEEIAIQARLDAETAYLALTPANMPGGQNPGNENLGNLTLAPGIYTAQSGAFSIQGGDLTLDAQGNQNAVWVFQMATTLTVGGPGADFPQSVTLINGAQAKNIFWQVGSAATINAAGGGTFKGTIIAQEGVSISTAGNVDIVTIDGRALSLGASVTMVNTVINVPAE